MSTHAAKRQKRGPDAADHGGSQNDDAYASQESKGPDENEEEIRRPVRRVGRPKAPESPTKSRKVALSHRKKQEDGLKQTSLDFSKSRAPPPPRMSEKIPEVTLGTKPVVAELQDDLIVDDGYSTTVKDAHHTRMPAGSEGQHLPVHVDTSGPRGSRKLQKGKLHQFTAESLGRSNLVRNASPQARTKTPSTHLPWAQQYGPQTLDELGVHKRKVADVRSWIDNVLNGYERKRLLILRGPSGSGKTATVQVLSTVLGFSILEWRNPLMNATAWGEYRSGAASFEDFLSRGQRYGSLDLTSSLDSTTNDSDRASLPASPSRQIILMEEDPQSYSHNTTVLQNFRSSIQRYLQAEETVFSIGGPRNAASLRSRPPIVMIVSESSNASFGPFSDNLSAYYVFGPEILSHPRVTTIEFNPIAPTILTKALELVASKVQRNRQSKVQASPAILHKIAESGDLRSAIGTLEFLSQMQDASMPQLPAKRRAKSKIKSDQQINASESALLDALAPRNPMLDLFHAVGKVVYNKRQPPPAAAGHPENPSPSTPAFVSEVDPDLLLDSTSHDHSTFISAIHENYILSCTGDDFVETFNACSDALSLSDTLSLDLLTHLSASFASSPAADSASLRQSDLAAHTAIRGLLRGLPYPVQRKGYSGGRDSFKMFWPESMRVRGRMEEVREQTRVWSGALPPRLERSSGLLEASLLIEVPYWAMISKARGEDTTVLASICGLSNSAWAAEAKEEEERGGIRPSHGKSKLAVKAESTSEADEMQSFIQGVGEKWVLSDDDIED